MVERTGFKKFKALAFRSEISLIPLIPDCNLSNKTLISAIRLKRFHNLHIHLVIPRRLSQTAIPQSDCNLRNQTAISAIRLKRFLNLHIHLVIPRRLIQTEISAIRLQSQQSDCILSNQTAIPTIELQSPQSDCYAGGLQSDFGDCSLIAEIAKVPQLTYTVGQSHGVSVTAISTIQLQSPQSNCNLHNPTAISTIRLQKFLNLHIQLVIQRRVGDCNLHNPTAISAIQL